MIILSGCAAPGMGYIAGQASADAALFAPLPLPPDFDGSRAMLALSDVPDDPPAPERIEQAEVVQLPRKAKRRLAEAERLFAEQKYTESIGELESVLRYDANNYQAHRMMALACLHSGSDNRARLFAERALAIKPDDLVCHYVSGRLLDKTRKYDRALREYRVALKCPLSPDDRSYRILTCYYLGLLLDRRCYYAAAIDQLESFQRGIQTLGDKVSDNPELAAIARQRPSSISLRVARAHELLGRFGLAADALESACRRLDKDFDLRKEYICMLVRGKRIDKASQEAQNFIADTAGGPDAVELLLAIHRFAGHPRRGHEILEKVVARQPENVDLALLYVDKLISAKQYGNARGTLEDLLVRFPDSTDARWKLIKLHRSRRDWSSLLLSLAGELADRPSDYERASGHLDSFSHLDAEVIVDEALGKVSGKPKYIPREPAGKNFTSAIDYLAGCLCDRLDRLEDARTLFVRSLDRRGGFLPATVGLARMYVKRCRWEEAIEVIKSGGELLQQPVGELEKILGQCYEGLDQYEPAVAHLEKAIQLNGVDVGAMMMLGRLYERRGLVANAQLKYQAAVDADPSNIAAREALVRNLWSRRHDQTDIFKRVASELMDLQRLAPNKPATIRCAAMFKYLAPPEPDFEAYAKVLKELIHAYPNDLQTREDLATTLFALRQYESARVELSELLTHDGYSAAANYMMAQVLIKLLAYDRAREQFERMLKWYPNRHTWAVSFGEFLLVVQDYDRAIEVWKRLHSISEVATDSKQSAVIRARLVQAYLEGDRFDEARQVAEGWLAKADPAKHDLIYLLRTFVLSVEQAAKDYDRYVCRCREWLEADPADRRIRNWLLTGLIGAKRFDEPILLILEWLSEKPSEAGLINWLVEVLQSAKRHDEAIEIIQSQLTTAKKTQSRQGWLTLLINAYIKAGEYQQAIANHKKLFAERKKALGRNISDSDQYDHRELHGQLLLQAGRFDEAVEYINKTIQWVDNRHSKVRELLEQTEDKRYLPRLLVEERKSRQRKAQLLRSLSVVYQRQERLDLAEERLREAYGLDPADIGTNNDLGYTLADAGRNLDEAERMIRYAVGEEPRQAAYLDSLGWVLYKRGRFAEAITWLSRAANLDAGWDAVIYDHLGDAQYRLERMDQALASWQQALIIHDEKMDEKGTDPDEKLVERVRNKIQKVRQKGIPAVAPISVEGD
ncbi:MAG: tetratricopeptide repeat protein [Planctomycetota bacterium]